MMLFWLDDFQSYNDRFLDFECFKGFPEDYKDEETQYRVVYTNIEINLSKPNFSVNFISHNDNVNIHKNGTLYLKTCREILKVSLFITEV